MLGPSECALIDPGDPLLALDPIFLSTPEGPRDRLLSQFSLDVTEEGFALGYVLGCSPNRALELGWRLKNCSVTELIFSRNRRSSDKNAAADITRRWHELNAVNRPSEPIQITG